MQYQGELFTRDESKELINHMKTYICELCGESMGEATSSPALTKHCKPCWSAITKLVKHYRENKVEIGLRAQYLRALAVLKKEWRDYGC